MNDRDDPSPHTQDRPHRLRGERGIPRDPPLPVHRPQANETLRRLGGLLFDLSLPRRRLAAPLSGRNQGGTFGCPGGSPSPPELPCRSGAGARGVVALGYRRCAVDLRRRAGAGTRPNCGCDRGGAWRAGQVAGAVVVQKKARETPGAAATHLSQTPRRAAAPWGRACVPAPTPTPVTVETLRPSFSARASCEIPCRRRAAWMRSPKVAGSGAGSYPRKATTLGRCQTATLACPSSQLTIVDLPTPSSAATSSCRSPRSMRTLRRCSPIVCGLSGYPGAESGPCG